ncbi:MAG TPA: hypothetical protein VKK79_18310 [Candidatus Lokiarchaeia archaeon]|nr:hypothetical protein [Candidatus Lokiarchaeia archaeon]
MERETLDGPRDAQDEPERGEDNRFDSLREVKLLLIVFLGYGVFYGISQVAGDSTVPISFWIPELGQQVTVAFPWESILSIFVTGAGFAILLVRVFDEIYMSPRSVVKDHLSPRARAMLRDFFIFTVAAYCLINAVHEVVKFVGYMLDGMALDLANPANANLYNYIYWYHEYFGHLFSIPLMIFFTVFALPFIFEAPSRNLTWYAWIFLIAIGVGFGATWVEGWAEGECQLVNALYDIGLLVAITVLLRKKGVSLRDHPFICVVAALTITFIIGVVVWGMVYGLLPYYPFFREPP